MTAPLRERAARRLRRVLDGAVIGAAGGDLFAQMPPAMRPPECALVLGGEAAARRSTDPMAWRAWNLLLAGGRKTWRLAARRAPAALRRHGARAPYLVDDGLRAASARARRRSSTRSTTGAVRARRARGGGATAVAAVAAVAADDDDDAFTAEDPSRTRRERQARAAAGLARAAARGRAARVRRRHVAPDVLPRAGAHGRRDRPVLRPRAAARRPPARRGLGDDRRLRARRRAGTPALYRRVEKSS